MRIVHVINRIAYGGAERQLVELTARSALEHEIVELDRLARGRVDAARRLGPEVDRLRPDAVVGWLDRPQIALALTRKRGRPFVAGVRGLPARSPGVHSWKLRLAFARFDSFVANSDAVRDATRRFARPLRLDAFTVIPNGVDLVPFRTPKGRRGALRIGFIGRAPDPDKGLDVLLAALDLLEPGEATATLIGPGVPEAAAGRHRAVGGVPDPWSLLGDIDVLVVPSRREGSPNVVIEAFARGVPVLATTVGGTSELIAAERGAAVEPDDPPALVRAIREVAADPLAAATRAETARTYVERVHAWPSVVEAFDSLLVGIADSVDDR